MIVALVLHLLLGVPTCTNEDGTASITTQPVCVWNAQLQGNHRGHSILWIGEEAVYLD